MKKRILALALAGTTAFSVFGAAVSANAASTHSVSGHDAYASYEQGTVTIKDGYNANTKVYMANGSQPSSMPSYLTEADKTALDTHNEYGVSDVTINGKTYSAGTVDGLVEWIQSYTDGTGSRKTHLDANYNTVVKAETGAHIYSTVVNGETQYHYLANGPKASETKQYTEVTDGTVFVGNTTTNSTEVVKLSDKSVTNTLREYVKNGGSTATNGKPVIVLDYYDLKNAVTLSQYGDVTATGDLSTAALSRTGETVESGTIYVNDYYVTTNNLANYAYAFASAWGAADMKHPTGANYYGYGYTNYADATSLINVVKAANKNSDNILNESDANKDGSFSGRSSVLQEYGEFLVEIGLASYYNNGTYYGGYKINADVNGDGKVNYLDREAFLAGYSYKYNGNDLYKFENLVDDIFDSLAGGNAYADYSSSHIVYLMQQYDKYVDGSYIDDEENGESKWAELLISALEAVDADDFAQTAQYTAFDRYRTNVINSYNDALTGSARMAAVKNLYNAVANTAYRTPAAKYDDLNNTLDSLYFNTKKLPSTYQAAVAYNDSNAENILYGYNGYNFADPAGKYYSYAGTYGMRATYPLYPMADYSQAYNENVVYTGNKTDKTFTGATSTDEYEWFWNVYQLATTIANKSAYSNAQGVVDTVNTALTEAVKALDPTKTATNAMKGVLDEVIENYTDSTNPTRVKEESDYKSAYWAAYQEGLDYAKIATGKVQNAYATEIATITGNTLGYDSVQVSVTKTMISDLNKKITEGTNALKAIKNSEKDYNAAQVNALNKAIDDAQNLVKLYNGTLSTSAKYQSEDTKYSNLKGDKDQMTVSDLKAAEAAIDSAINYKNILQGWSKNDAGKWQYGTEDGYLSNGWNKVGATWYYFNADGTAKQSEWLQENGKWYYFNSNCGALCGWGKVDGNWYYFKGDNHMKTGWEKVDGNWYYLASSGKMVTGWTQIDGKWYYFSKESNSLGQMLANTTVDGYKLDANGVWNK